MGWYENQKTYVKGYLKEKYHRISFTLRNDGKDADDERIWNAIKDSKSKVKAMKELMLKGLDAEAGK